MTSPRLNAAAVSPEPYELMLALSKGVAASGLEESLLELVKIRASQINRCAFCLDMHTIDARAAGETEQRIYALSAWEETPFFSDRERAALAWTEAVTLIGEAGVPESLYRETSAQFSEKELVDLTWAVATINSWNRLAITFHAQPGHYRAGMYK